MSNLVRFGVSIDKSLLEKFDELIRNRSYTNRSEAFRDMIRRELVESEWEFTDEIAGALTIIYNHHKRELLNKITGVQHKFQEVIISSTHIHLDHDNCMEVIALLGNPDKVKKLADSLKAIKGVKYGVLSVAGTRKQLD
jgi:CopG family nickel-responsive transcriptional regulator